MSEPVHVGGDPESRTSSLFDRLSYGCDEPSITDGADLKQPVVRRLCFFQELVRCFAQLPRKVQLVGHGVVEVLPCHLGHLIFCLGLAQLEVGHHRRDDADTNACRGGAGHDRTFEDGVGFA